MYQSSNHCYHNPLTHSNLFVLVYSCVYFSGLWLITFLTCIQISDSTSGQQIMRWKSTKWKCHRIGIQFMFKCGNPLIDLLVLGMLCKWEFTFSTGLHINLFRMMNDARWIQHLAHFNVKYLLVHNTWNW